MARPMEVTGPSPAAATTASVEELIGEYDQERPGRRLSPTFERWLTLACFLVSAFVLRQVFAPLQQGGQYYLILFLAGVLRWSSSATAQGVAAPL